MSNTNPDEQQVRVNSLIEGKPGIHVIGPMTPTELLQRMADSELPGSLYARLLLNDDIPLYSTKLDLGK